MGFNKKKLVLATASTLFSTHYFEVAAQKKRLYRL